MRHIRKANFGAETSTISVNSDNKLKTLFFTGSILPPAKESSTTEIDLKLTTELFLGPQGDNVTELSKDNFDKIQEFLDSGKPEDIADGSTCQVVSSFSSVHSIMKEFRSVGTILEAPKFIPDPWHLTKMHEQKYNEDGMTQTRAAQCIDKEILISKNGNIDIEIDKRMF